MAALFLRLQNRFYSTLKLNVGEYLRSKNCHYEECFTSFVLVFPKHVILEEASFPPSGAKFSPDRLCKILVDKETGHFSDPHSGLFGNFKQLQDFITLKKKCRKTSLKLEENYENELTSFPLLNHVSQQEFKHILKVFKLPKFKPTDFQPFDVRVDLKKEILYFPIYFSETLVGVRKVFQGQDGNISEVNHNNDGHERLLPLIHGLHQMTPNTDSVVIVPSVLDSVALKVR